MISRFAQVRKYHEHAQMVLTRRLMPLRARIATIESGSSGDRDTLGVARPVDDRRMTVQLDCPWCQDEVAFEVDETADELVCTACGIRSEFAPDPVATYSLLYEAA
jgi:hypothetical protein